MIKFDFGSAEGTVWRFDLGLDPLHDAVVVENVFAWRHTHHCRPCEVFHADRAVFLILFMFNLSELLLGEQLRNESKFLSLLLFQDPLRSHGVVDSVTAHCVCIFDGVLALGPVFAEDAEARATA